MRNQPLTRVSLAGASSTQQPAHKKKLFGAIGPGLITGASDDDPSGIATYSQAGAQFGYALSWTLLFSYPLMVTIQQISARIGCVTGKGIAGNLRDHYPGTVLYSVLSLLFIANTLNIAADLGAMAAALKLLVGGPSLVFVAAFGLVSAAVQIFTSYTRYAAVLKWLTLSLLAYVATALVVKVPWGTVLVQLVVPDFRLTHTSLTVIVAILGTTISPYLFFWQAGQEVEDGKARPDRGPLKHMVKQAPVELERIRLDTYIGMAISNLVALFIMITTAATLHASGHTDIQSAQQAAEALRPVAGNFAFAVFAMGIIGTGLLAVPVLAGSAAYACGEALRWPVGLAREPQQAKRFYAMISLIFVAAIVVNFLPIDPMKGLFWSAVINGVVAVPVMTMMMLLTAKRKVMGELTLSSPLKITGWLATLVMGVATISMLVGIVA